MQSLKALARDALARLLLGSGASRPEKVCRGKLLILTFHRVLPEHLRREYPLPGLVVTPEELHWIISALHAHFELHTVSDAIRRLNERSSSRPLLAISFDDGQWDNLQYAAPVLQGLRVHATFYVPTDFIGQSTLLWHDRAAFAWQRSAAGAKQHALARLPGNMCATTNVSGFLEALKSIEPAAREAVVQSLSESAASAVPDWARLMNWQEVARLHQLGHEIGSHSCSHALLPQLDPKAQSRELEQSMHAISRELDVRVASFCYPNGSYDALSIEAAARAGYENAVTTKWGLNDPSRPRFELLRCDMDARRLVDRRGALSHARLAMRIAGFQPGLAT